MTDKQIARLVEYWQHRLNLTHWDLEVQIVSIEDIPGDYANISIHTQHQYALIRITNPKFLPTSGPTVPQSFERLLVHEMLHIYTEAIARQGESELPEERSINILADALVSLREEIPS